jgi:predicted protein tyrosine phosphatase
MPFPRRLVEAGEVSADALISVGPSPSGGYAGEVPAIPPGLYGAILRLSFDDIGCAQWADDTGQRWRGPSIEDTRSALDFADAVFTADPDAALAIHCEMGRSRSAALALGVNARLLGPGREADAVWSLLVDDRDGQMCFNPLIVRHLDALLGRDRAIEDALATLCRPFVTWREFWVRKGVLPVSGLPVAGGA